VQSGIIQFTFISEASFLRDLKPFKESLIEILMFPVAIFRLIEYVSAVKLRERLPYVLKKLPFKQIFRYLYKILIP
jgi:hypothetical protein